MSEATSSIVFILLIIVIMVFMRVCCTLVCRNVVRPPSPGVRRRVVRRIRIGPMELYENTGTARDRQGNIFTISDDVSSNQTDVYGERIRTQLEKDDKDLPSYEEVMRMSLADFAPPPPTQVPATPNTDTILMVPPSYAEVDPFASPPAVNSTAQSSPAAPGVASTSRAAAAAASANPSGEVAIDVTISPSNTSV